MRIAAAVVLLASLTAAQGVFFECQAPGAAIPPIGSPDCEGLVLSGTGTASIYTAAIFSGLFTMPVEGQGFLQVDGGLVTVPQGGPLPRPLSGSEGEVRVPIPAGANAVSFWWTMEWYTHAGCPWAQGCVPMNGGLDVSVVDASGNLLVQLVYRDALSRPQGSAPVAAFLYPGTYVPQLSTAVLPTSLPGAYLSIVAWRGSVVVPNTLPTFVGCFVDAIAFSVPSSQLTLSMISPLGAGSLEILLRSGAPATPYLTLLTTNAGSFPNGAFAGIDILTGELAAQLAFVAPPIQGLTDAGGMASYLLGPAILPSGLALYGVSGNLDPATGILKLSAPTAVTIL